MSFDGFESEFTPPVLATFEVTSAGLAMNLTNEDNQGPAAAELLEWGASSPLS